MAWVINKENGDSSMMDKLNGRTMSGIDKTTSAMFAEKMLFGDATFSDDTTTSFQAPPPHPALMSSKPVPPPKPTGGFAKEVEAVPSPLPDADRRTNSFRPGPFARVTLGRSSRLNSLQKAAAGKSSAPAAGTEAEPADEWGIGQEKAIDDDGMNLFDFPTRLTNRPGTMAKMKDLERQSIMLAEARNRGSSGEDIENLSRATGDIWVRQWILPIWRRRYASVVDHAYFGPVLFLFKYQDSGFVGVKHSVMIALDSADVALGRNILDKDGLYKMEFILKTEKRKYTFAAPDHMKREYWIEHLRSVS